MPCQFFGNIASPVAIDQPDPLRGLVEPQFPGNDIKLEQSHATTDVGTDKGRVDIAGENAAAHGFIFSRVKVRHSGNGENAALGSHGFELARRIALDPGFGRVKGVDRHMTGCWMQITQGKCLSGNSFQFSGCRIFSATRRSRRQNTRPARWCAFTPKNKRQRMIFAMTLFFPAGSGRPCQLPRL